MPGLSDLGLRRGWIYEVIATTFNKGGPHAAPVGISSPDLKVCELTVYKTAHTLANIQEAGELAVNLTHDLALFEAALHAKDSLAYESAAKVKAPLLAGAECTLELKVSALEDMGNRSRITARPVHVSGALAAPPLNRAGGLYLESLVLETRVGFLGIEKIGPALLENHRVICKVAPGSQLESLSGKLLTRQGLESRD